MSKYTSEEMSGLRPTDLKPAFSTTRLEEEKKDDKGKVITVRLNDKDIEVLEEFKEMTGTKADNTAIRGAIYLARNVIQAHFADGLNHLFFKKGRIRK